MKGSLSKFFLDIYFRTEGESVLYVYAIRTLCFCNCDWVRVTSAAAAAAATPEHDAAVMMHELAWNRKKRAWAILCVMVKKTCFANSFCVSCLGRSLSTPYLMKITCVSSMKLE